MQRPKGFDLAVLIGSVSVFFASCWLSLSPLLLAEDAINVHRDQDKTVYTIGSGSRNGQEDQDGASGMPNNGHRHGPKKRPGQPVQTQPSQPAHGKQTIRTMR